MLLLPALLPAPTCRADETDTRYLLHTTNLFARYVVLCSRFNLNGSAHFIKQSHDEAEFFSVCQPSYMSFHTVFTHEAKVEMARK